MSKTKKQRLVEKTRRLNNKRLLKKYPWLYPYNVWTGKKLKDYNYEFTWADDIPRGWMKSFGDLMFEEIDEVLRRTHTNIFIQQIKEKFGQLRFYCSAHKDIQDIISKYSVISENVCISCGKPDTHMLDTGWLSPYCEECFGKMKYYKDKNYDDFVCDESNIIRNTYSYTRFSKDGNEKITVDISDTVQKIRKRYYRCLKK